MRADVDGDTRPFARITLKHDDLDERKTITSEGQGPIDAAFSAVCAITGVQGRISLLDLNHIADEGIVRAKAVVGVGNEQFSGMAEEVDVADAAVAAFVAAINQAADVIALRGRVA